VADSNPELQVQLMANSAIKNQESRIKNLYTPEENNTPDSQGAPEYLRNDTSIRYSSFTQTIKHIVAITSAQNMTSHIEAEAKQNVPSVPIY
jgi:hypothetical protein